MTPAAAQYPDFWAHFTTQLRKRLRIGDGEVFEKRQPNICTNAQ